MDRLSEWALLFHGPRALQVPSHHRNRETLASDETHWGDFPSIEWNHPHPGSLIHPGTFRGKTPAR